ncbi:MAG: hypothetical protein QXX56_02920 [Candidatus Bathyarchaeia archaeon]
MERTRKRGESLLLIFTERLIGFILMILSIILLHGAYSVWTSLGETVSSLFIAIGIVLLILGLIMLLSRIE